MIAKTDDAGGRPRACALAVNRLTLKGLDSARSW